VVVLLDIIGTMVADLINTSVLLANIMILDTVVVMDVLK
jgi:hypothetical protein